MKDPPHGGTEVKWSMKFGKVLTLREWQIRQLFVFIFCPKLSPEEWRSSHWNFDHHANGEGLINKRNSDCGTWSMYEAIYKAISWSTVFLFITTITFAIVISLKFKTRYDFVLGHYPLSHLLSKISSCYISKHNVSETGFYFLPQVKPTLLGPIDRVGITWGWR
jgi:hypothetical protein